MVKEKNDAPHQYGLTHQFAGGCPKDGEQASYEYVLRFVDYTTYKNVYEEKSLGGDSAKKSKIIASLEGLKAELNGCESRQQQIDRLELSKNS